jgi:hypothetical protein
LSLPIGFDYSAGPVDSPLSETPRETQMSQ